MLTQTTRHATMKQDNRPHCGPPNSGQAGRRPDQRQAMATQDITLDDIDEALMYAALTHKRDTPWVTWVNQLLDERNKLNKQTTTQNRRQETT